MKYLLFAAAVAVASPALAQSAAAQEAPAESHAGHAGHNVPAPSTAEPAGQPAQAVGDPAGPGMKECCCCAEGEHQGHEAMMRHAETDAEAAPAQHQHR